VAQDGNALKWASEVLKNDPEVKLAAVAAIENPMFEFIPTIMEPLSDLIIEALESASAALRAFEEWVYGAEEAIVAECNRIKDIEKAIDKAILRIIRAPDSVLEKQEYLDSLGGLNAYLGNIDNNPCVRMQLKASNKRQKIEAAFVAARTRASTAPLSTHAPQVRRPPRAQRMHGRLQLVPRQGIHH